MIVEQFKNTKWLSNQITFSESGKFIYMKPAKNAGTSIFRKTIQPKIPDAICRLYSVGNDTHGHILQNKDNSTKKFEEWLNNLTDEEVLNDYFTFTFVRNPFDRIVSAYFHIILGNQKRDISFKEFVKYNLLDDAGYPLNEHWLPQHLHTYCDDKCFMDYIGNVETLEDDWKYVAGKIKVNDTLPHVRPKASDAPERKSSDYRVYYEDDETIEIVSKIYKKDLKLFNYEFENLNRR